MTRRRLTARQWSRRVRGWALVLVLGIGCVTTSAPLLWMVLSSFKNSSEIVQVPMTWWPNEFTFAAYRDLWSGIPLLNGYKNSIIVTLSVTAATVFTSSLAGYVFAKKEFWGRDALFFFVLSTMMVPFVILLVPLYFGMVQLHLNDTLLGLIIPSLFSSYGIFLMRQFMHGIPDEMLEAAIIDGASDWRIYFQIIVPLTKPAMSALAIFAFMGSFNGYLWPLVVIDSPDKQTLPLVLAEMTGSNVVYPNWQMAAATLTVVPVLIFYLIFQRNFVQGIALTGLKG